MFYWITLFELMEEVIHLWYHYGGGKKSEKSSQVPQGIQSDGLMQRRWKFLKFVSSRKHGSTFPNWSKWRTRLSNHLRPVKCYSLSPWSGSLNDKFPLLIKKIFHQNEIYAPFFFSSCKTTIDNAFIASLVPPNFSIIFKLLNLASHAYIHVVFVIPGW